MYSTRTTAIATGVFFLITHVTSVAAVLLYAPFLADPGTGDYSTVLGATVLDVVLALSVVGTSLAIYPVVRRFSEGLGLGYVALRTLEAGVILTGAVMLMAAVALRSSSADTAVTNALVEAYKYTFIVGPGFVCAANTVVLAWLLYVSRLVPRFIPVLGLIGGPVIFLVNLAKLFDLYDSLPWIGVAVIPIFAWEICLAVYLIARGFRPQPIARLAQG